LLFRRGCSGGGVVKCRSASDKRKSVRSVTTIVYQLRSSGAAAAAAVLGNNWP